MQRAIRLHYERVVGAALVLAVFLPLYFLLTGFAVAGANQNQAAVSCGSTVVALGKSQPTHSDPSGGCHAGAVQRLHLAGGYFGACLVVALAVWVLAGARERALNRAWEAERVPSRWFSTPGQVWLFAALLFVVLGGVAQGL